jgi:hypothetical protein
VIQKQAAKIDQLQKNVLDLEEQMLKNESLQVADKLKVEEHLAICYSKISQGRELVLK